MPTTHLKTASHQASVLVVEDDQYALQNVLTTLKRQQYRVTGFPTAVKALKTLETERFDVIISDVKLPVMDGLEFIGECKRRNLPSKYIIITGYAEESSVIRALRLGVDNFLKKPYREGELLHSVAQSYKMLRLEEENEQYRKRLEVENGILRRELDKRLHAETFALVGSSAALQKCIAQADKIGQHSINALIRGESGTGKEMMAQYIHHNGARRNKPFIAVNCAALSPSLFESELFGYEKGAFTGALESRPGLFEIADGGIIFLDELTEIPTGLQAKLLRVVESQVVRRVGGTESRNVDVQILCSTNRIISDAIEHGFLRLDIYHRLATVEIVLPPLRERSEDIQELLRYFLELYKQQLSVSPPPMPERIVQLLSKQRWEGNIRQFSNVIKRWCLFGAESEEHDVAAWIAQSGGKPSLHTGLNEPNYTVPNHIVAQSAPAFQFSLAFGTFDELEEIKRRLINDILAKYKGNKTRAAQHLGVSYPGLLKMLKAMQAENTAVTEHENNSPER